MEVNDSNGNSITYISHIQKLFEEYEQLQLEYSRLRQQLNDHVVLPKNDSHYTNENNNRTVDDLRVELEFEKAQNKPLRNEVVYLLDQVRKTQKRYNDLMSIMKNDKEKPAVSDLDVDKRNELNMKVAQLESEIKELKENNEFIVSENSVLSDSIKDLEETLFKERMEWIKEKESHEEVLKYSRSLYDKSKEHNAKVEELEKQLSMFEKFALFVHESILKCSGENEQNEAVLKEIDDSKQIDIDAKVKFCKKAIQNGIFIRKNHFKNSNDTSNANNANVTMDSSTLKAKVTELYQQIETLTTDNKCLLSENGELKNLIGQKNIDCDQVKLKLEIANLTAKLTEQQETNDKLMQKYTRNRKVWEENEKNFNEEMEKSDNFIAVLVDTLKKLPPNLKNCPELQNIIALIDQSESDKTPK